MKLTFDNVEELKAFLPSLKKAQTLTITIECEFFSPLRRTCEQCGQAFVAMRSTAKFCSASCKTTASRNRAKAS